jgi:hypothetical protein
MLATAFSRYINNYRGFTREIWILTLITLCAGDGFAISIQIFKRRFELVLRWSGMDHGRFRDGVHVGFLAGGKLSDIGFTKSWFSVCSPILLFLYSTSILFFCGECLIFHNDRADMFRPAMFVSLPIQNPRIAPGHDFSSVSGEFRFRGRTSWRIIMNMGYGGYSG